MKTRLLFATNNQHKIDEMRNAIGHLVDVVGLRDAGIDIDIAEPHHSLEENASEKSSAIFALTGMSCFSEDTGLEVEALAGEPGVRSARYAGEDSSSENNISKLLSNMEGMTQRQACFRTVISLIWGGHEHLFEGVCKGSILRERRGTSGFGYDAVFAPTGGDRSFAEMNMTEKNVFSHRRKAADKLVLFLQKESGITAHL